MRILVTGGGTGGHVTPLRPIIDSIRSSHADATIIFAYKRGDRFAALLDDQMAIDQRVGFFSGKFRRYPNQSLLEKVTDISTMALNIRDAFFIAIGCVQAVFYLAFNRPDVIFSKSGPASIPLGIVGNLFSIPIITHDSDLIPSWTHRLIGRWARFNAVASEAGEYPYNKDTQQVVGVPVRTQFTRTYTQKDRTAARKSLGIQDSKPLVFVIGGSLGARSINTAMTANASVLVALGYHVVHVSGENNFTEVEKAIEAQNISQNYKILPFIADQEQLFSHFLAADLVVSRASATSTAELANLAKPAIIIPAKQLADQLKNASFLAESGAAHVLDEVELDQKPDILMQAIKKIVDDANYSKKLAKTIHSQAISDTSDRVVKLINTVLSQ